MQSPCHSTVIQAESRSIRGFVSPDAIMNHNMRRSVGRHVAGHGTVGLREE